MNRKTIVSLLLVALLIAVEAVAELPDTIDKIRGSVVGIGTVFPSAKHRDAASPPMTFRGTGFAVGNGRQVVTNYHVIEKVVEKFILELEMQLEDRGVHIRISPAAKAFIADKGYDMHFGARPLKRVIQEEIKRPLADELLFGRLVEGGEVKIGFKDKKITLDIEPGKILPKPKTKRKKKVKQAVK